MISPYTLSTPDKKEPSMTATATKTTGDHHPKQPSWLWDFLLRPILEFAVRCWPRTTPLFFPNCLPEPPNTCKVTGTIICPVDGSKVRLCMQVDPSAATSASPFVLLNLPLDISEFARLVQLGMSRIVLECYRDHLRYRPDNLWLPTVPRWTAYCNGHRIGYATRREVNENDRLLLEMLQTVSTGVGILPEKGPESSESSQGFKYLRGQFEKVVGSADAEAYHLVDPFGCLGQELSIFFLMH